MTDSIIILCSGQLRSLPYAIWANLKGPKPEDPSQFVCNGCSYSPDYICGKRAWPACVIHDYQYNATGLPRSEADSIFRSNLKYSLEADGMPGWLAGVFASFYYRIVRREGKHFYNSQGRND